MVQLFSYLQVGWLILLEASALLYWYHCCWHVQGKQLLPELLDESKWQHDAKERLEKSHLGIGC